MRTRRNQNLQGEEGCSKWNEEKDDGKEEEENRRQSSNKSMKTLRDAILEVVAASCRIETTTAMRISVLLDQILCLNTPDHPSYAEMIYKAIEVGGGSNEATISSYIKSQYQDLPWPHQSLLSYHLAQLSFQGKIVRDTNGCYKLPTINPAALLQVQIIDQQKPRIKMKKVGMKRRGRPPKNDKLLIMEGKNSSFEVIKLDDEDIVMKNKEKKVFSGPKKRRGRPPKTKLEADGGFVL